MSALFFCSFAPGRFGLEFFEQRIEALVVLFEDLAVTFDPSHGLLQSLWFQFARTPLRIDVRRDEAGALFRSFVKRGRAITMKHQGEDNA